MFDVSFSELLVIAVVALIVIGPEKLPKVARTLGAISGRMQRYVAQVKEEVNRETRFEGLQQLQTEIQAAAAVAEQKVRRTVEDAQVSVGKLQEDVISEPIVEPASTQEVKKPAIKRAKKISKNVS